MSVSGLFSIFQMRKLGMEVISVSVWLILNFPDEKVRHGGY